jgi:hypothetical protein
MLQLLLRLLEEEVPEEGCRHLSQLSLWGPRFYNIPSNQVVSVFELTWPMLTARLSSKEHGRPVLFVGEIVAQTDTTRLDDPRGRCDRSWSVSGWARCYLPGMQQHWLEMDFGGGTHTANDV